MIKIQTIVAQRRRVRFSSKHNALLAGDPLSTAIEERRRFAAILIRYSLGRKCVTLRLYSQIQLLITQQPTVRFDSTMAYFLAKRSLSTVIEERGRFVAISIRYSLVRKCAPLRGDSPTSTRYNSRTTGPIKHHDGLFFS